VSTLNQLEEMIFLVAKALGHELLQEVAFLGGSVTGLLLTDNITKEAVRYTDDVDLITNVIGRPQWVKFQERLRKQGFRESIEDDINCRMRLKNLIVDFMPDDENILGYTNRWYKQALKDATPYNLRDKLIIQLVTPVHFIATKLEAYKGRGNNDPMQSRDIEDILNIFDGREEIAQEIEQYSDDVKGYISEEIAKLLSNQDFEYAVQSASQNQPEREALIFSRLEKVAHYN